MPVLPPEIIELRKTYQNAQIKLLEIIANETATGSPTAYRKRILAGVNEELRILDKYANEWVNKNVVDAYKNSMIETYQVYRKANIDVPKVAFNTAVVKLITENAASKFLEAHTYIGRRIDDEIRKATVSVIAEKVATGSTIKQVKARLLESFADNGIQAIKDKNGRHIQLDAYAEMVGRTTTREATNQGTIDEMHSVRGDLVKMTQHFSSCPVCVPYEGRVYSISGNDKRFPALYETAFKGGYNTIHPNCSHNLVAVVEKYNDMDALQKESNRPFEIRESDKKSIAAYNKRQDIKTKQRNDRNKWQKALMDDPTTPKTFAGYQSRQRALKKQAKPSEQKIPKVKNIENLNNYKNITDDELRKMAAVAHKNTLDMEKVSIKKYTAAGYENVNGLLRNKIKPKDLIASDLSVAQKLIFDLDNIKKYKIPNDLRVYRAASRNALGLSRIIEKGDNLNDLVGTEILDKGFGSTSVDKKVSDKYFGSTKMNIHIPEGSGVIPINGLSKYEDESEILLPRNARYKIIDIQRDEKKIIIDLLYLGSE